MATRGETDGSPDGFGPLADDGLPTLPTGEPVLPRWFVIVMLALVPVAVAVTVWAFTSVDRERLSAAERRPAGGPTETVARGAAELAETRDVEPGPGCAQAIRIVGDDGSRTAAARVIEPLCELIATGRHPQLRAGLVRWIAGDGQLRVATFELAGVTSSAREEDGRLVVELNARFQFDAPERAVPALAHQLVLLTDDAWPGAPVGVQVALRAAAVQQAVCEELGFGADDRPRDCVDAEELLAADDPAGDLIATGYRDDR